jgi:transcriptional regulator GlxA family with amidase domain
MRHYSDGFCQISAVTIERSKSVVIVAFPDVQPIDVIGPAEVFSEAAAITDGAYLIDVVSTDAEPIPTRGGYSIAPSKRLAEVGLPVDTVIVAGGPGVGTAERDERLVAWITRAAERSRRVASVCSGTSLLAAAGLLDGRRATSHWAGCADLARRFPAVDVDPDPIFLRDGHIWTAAGASAGIDMALAMVEQDLGRRVALAVARWLVVFLQRPGGQSQFSGQLAAQLAEREPVREVQDWIADHLDEELRVDEMARRAHMSARNFARVFRRETGTTPAAYVESLRVDWARRCLEDGDEPVETVARRCGFGTPETMRRAFARRLAVSPTEYRARFRGAESVRLFVGRDRACAARTR